MTVTDGFDVLTEFRAAYPAMPVVVVSASDRTSDVIRAALQFYLDQPERAAPRSAFELGAELFGRHHGAADLAQGRKRAVADAWAQRHARRGA